jgi:glyoxylate reductase
MLIVYPLEKQEKRPRVYITRMIPEAGLNIVSEYCDVTLNKNDSPPTRKMLIEKVSGISGIICMLSDRIDAEVMDAAGPNLRVISSYSTGFEHIDIKEATKRGIYVTYTSDILTEATADLAFALLLSVARKLVNADRFVRLNKWNVGWMPNLFLGANVYDSTLGILGLGKIGTAVARRARGFNMNIIYNNRSKHKPEAESRLGARYVDFETLLAQSDFLSIHVNMHEDNYHLFDLAKFKKMKNSSFIINTARGQLINEHDLVVALKSNIIAGAGLDVFEQEPLSSTSPLLKMDNVVILPHIASSTVQTRSQMAEVAAKNLLNVIRGKDPIYLVNPEVKQIRPLKN